MPTWTRLDPLVFGVALAAIENSDRNRGESLINLRAVALAAGDSGSSLCGFFGSSDPEVLTVSPASGSSRSSLSAWPRCLVCAVSPRLPRRLESLFPAPRSSPALPTAPTWFRSSSLTASNSSAQTTTSISTSAAALVGVELCVYAAANRPLPAVERPFLVLRRRLTARK